MIKKVIKFILIVLCMVVIFMFSSDNADMSTEKSDGLIISVCEKECSFYFIFFIRIIYN